MHSTEEKQKPSTITLQNRTTLSLDGVSDVLSFDESAVLLQTTLGTLSVEGEGLHILSLALESGIVSMSGKINALFYTERGSGAKGGFFSRLFH